MAGAIRRHIEGIGADDRTPGPATRFTNPIRSLEELREVPGVDVAVLTKAAPYLTVDGDRSINQAVASDTVRAAAFGDLATGPSRLVLIARGWKDGHPLSHEIQAVFAISDRQLVLVAWRERTL
jgi:type II secretory pathway component PulK